MAIELAKTNSIQRYGSNSYQVPLSCDMFEYDTHENALFFPLASIWYKWEEKNDGTSVVNSKLQVRVGFKHFPHTPAESKFFLPESFHVK